MPVTQKVLAQGFPSATVLTDTYTVGGATQATVSSITVCNQSSTPDVFSVSVAVAGASDTPAQYIYSDIVIPGNDTFTATLGITLAATDVVRCLSQNGTTSFNLFGVEST